MIGYVVGSGGSEGTPSIGFNINSSKIANYVEFEKRKSSSYVYFSSRGNVIIVDVGSNPFDYVRIPPNAIFISHWHSDHTQMLPSVRWLNNKTDCFCPEQDHYEKRIIFDEPRNLVLHYIEPFKEIKVKDFKITPVTLNHCTTETYGFIIKDELNTIYHLLDTKGLPDETFDFLMKNGRVDAVIIDTCYAETPDQRIGKSGNQLNCHNTLEEALEIGLLFGKKVYLTHLPVYSPTVLSLHNYLRRKGYDNVFILTDGSLIQP